MAGETRNGKAGQRVRFASIAVFGELDPKTFGKIVGLIKVRLSRKSEAAAQGARKSGPRRTTRLESGESRRESRAGCRERIGGRLFLGVLGF